MLMSCLISVLLELARLIGTYNMTYNISTVIFDHNFKFSPQAVLLCGISDSFFFLGGGGVQVIPKHGLNPTSPVPHYLPFKKISEFLSPMTFMIK